MNSIIEKINNFFKNDVSTTYEKYKNVKSRNRKININSMLKYLFLYSKKENTKATAARKSKIATRTAFTNKLKSIKVEFFKELFNELTRLKKELIADDSELIKLNDILNNKIAVLDKDSVLFDICSADGTCNDEIKEGRLFTNSNVHIYNNSKQEPNDIVDNNNNFEVFDNNKNNKSNKNHEISLLLKFINSKSEDELKRIIIILDRAYSSYDLISELNERNIKYIIRLRENLDILKESKKHSSNITKINKILNDPNVRIIKNIVETDNEFTLNVTETKTIKTINNYYLITNLADAKDFSDNLIIDLYRYRWEIEVYFRRIKSLFKYRTFYLNSDEEIYKMKIISNIVFIVVKILILISLKHNYGDSVKKLNNVVNMRIPKKIDKRTTVYKNFLNSKTYEAKVNINFNHFYSTFSDEVLIDLIDGKLDNNHIKILNQSIEVNKDKQNRKYKRKSLIPFTKWYVKMYHKVYKDKKVYEAVISGTTDNLDKNLKLRAYQIIKDMEKICV